MRLFVIQDSVYPVLCTPILQNRIRKMGKIGLIPFSQHYEINDTARNSFREDRILLLEQNLSVSRIRLYSKPNIPIFHSAYEGSSKVFTICCHETFPDVSPQALLAFRNKLLYFTELVVVRGYSLRLMLFSWAFIWMLLEEAPPGLLNFQQDQQNFKRYFLELRNFQNCTSADPVWITKKK